MRIVIFGLTISSSWGNGHATLWRGLCRALARRGHHITFFERDVPYYAAHRDAIALDGVELVLYTHWAQVRERAIDALAGADVGIITSYCADAVVAMPYVAERARLAVFYDMDTPVTLDGLQRGEPVPYIGRRGLRDFDLVLSYTGGRALHDLRTVLGARRVAPLYGSVDPDVHRPTAPAPQYAADLSYLGTYATDRQEALERLFVDAARALPERRFVIGGAQYPQDFPWSANIAFVRHLPPAEHPAFYSSSPMTLNVTRRAMAAMGYCPSGRLFEAAACGCAILTDTWAGLEQFFTPGEEVLVASNTDDTLAALGHPREELARIGARARERALAEHTAERRALELEAALQDAFDAPAATVPFATVPLATVPLATEALATDALSDDALSRAFDATATSVDQLPASTLIAELPRTRQQES